MSCTTKPTAKILQSISFFGNCKGYHLKRFACKDLFQAVPLCQIRRLCFYCFCKGSEYFIFTCSVPMQNYAQSQIVIWIINFIYYVIVKCLYTGDSSVQYTFFQKSVCNSTDKNTENITDSKMNPSRFFFCFFRYLLHIISRKCNSCLLPCRTVFDSFDC